jgi:hypothetical protein
MPYATAQAAIVMSTVHNVVIGHTSTVSLLDGIGTGNSESASSSPARGLGMQRHAAPPWHRPHSHHTQRPRTCASCDAAFIVSNQ